MKLIISLLLIIIPSFSYACSCAFSSLEFKFLDSDYAYIGLVEKSELIEGGEVINKLEVIEILKGNPETTNLITQTDALHGMCVLSAVVGYKYIVYGKMNEVPKMSLCSYSQPIRHLQEAEINEIRAAANKAKQAGTR